MPIREVSFRELQDDSSQKSAYRELYKNNLRSHNSISLKSIIEKSSEYLCREVYNSRSPHLEKSIRVLQEVYIANSQNDYSRSLDINKTRSIDMYIFDKSSNISEFATLVLSQNLCFYNRQISEI